MGFEFSIIPPGADVLNIEVVSNASYPGQFLSVALYSSAGVLIDSGVTSTTPNGALNMMFTSHRVLAGTYHLLLAGTSPSITLFAINEGVAHMAYMLNHATDGMPRVYTVASQLSWAAGVPSWNGTLGTKVVSASITPTVMFTR